MPHKSSSHPDLVALPQLSHETLYVGVDVGKRAHVAGFLSSTLLTRHQRFEHCPVLAFDNSGEGFRSLLDHIQTYVSLTQVQALLEVVNAWPPRALARKIPLAYGVWSSSRSSSLPS